MAAAQSGVQGEGGKTKKLRQRRLSFPRLFVVGVDMAENLPCQRKEEIHVGLGQGKDKSRSPDTYWDERRGGGEVCLVEVRNEATTRWDMWRFVVVMVVVVVLVSRSEWRKRGSKMSTGSRWDQGQQQNIQ